MGEFGTNGNVKTVIVGYSFEYSLVSSTDVNAPNPQIDWTLQRWHGGKWNSLIAGSFVGTISSIYDPEIKGFRVHEQCHGSSTMNDGLTGAGNTTYRILVNQHIRWSGTGVQELSLSVTEQ